MNVSGKLDESQERGEEDQMKYITLSFLQGGEGEIMYRLFASNSFYENQEMNHNNRPTFDIW